MCSVSTEPIPASPPGPAPVGAALRERVRRLRVLEEEERRFRPSVYWYLTFRCNLACAHCSVQSSPWVDSSKDLTTDECMQVVEQLAELDVHAALLTGGELLIRPDALRILEALADRGIMAGVETNGIHYPAGFFELARAMQARGLFAMTVSLDGGTPETHERLRGPKSFERTVAGLHLLKEHGIRFNVQCVLNHENYGTIPDLYRLAGTLFPECGTVQWGLLNPVGRGAGLVQELGLQPGDVAAIFELIKGVEAEFPGKTVVKVPPGAVPPRYLPLVAKGAGIKSVTTCQFPLLGILPNGDVTVCAVSRENADLRFGNVRDEGFRLKLCWERTRMDMLRSRYVAAEHLAGICGDCVWKYSCKGACRAWAYEEGDSFDAPFPLCKALDEAGAFPKAYRLSSQNAAAAAAFQKMSGGCGCSL
jgi:radical SAM protein with 4Fe4S-binding SPASM domain